MVSLIFLIKKEKQVKLHYYSDTNMHGYNIADLYVVHDKVYKKVCWGSDYWLTNFNTKLFKVSKYNS